MVKYLLSRHEIWIASLLHRPEDTASVEELRALGAKVIAAPAPSRISLTLFLKSLFSRRPYKAHRFMSKELLREIKSHQEQYEFDVIHAQNFYMAQYVDGSEDARKVYYKENFEGLLLKRYADTLNCPLCTAFWKRESRKTANYELELASRFDNCICISPVDAAKLHQRKPEIHWEVLPACIDTAHHALKRREASPPVVLFLGMLNYFPNVDGARFFVEKIWDKVREEIPEAELHICGHSPSDSVKRLERNEGVRVIGPIEDAREAMEKCSVFIIPLRVGGGVRLKLLQALSTGCPVVSTSIGCEGLEFTDGEHLLVADEPTDFANAISRLLKNDELRIRLGQAGRKRVEERYRPQVVLPRLEEVYLQE